MDPAGANPQPVPPPSTFPVLAANIIGSFDAAQQNCQLLADVLNKDPRIHQNQAGQAETGQVHNENAQLLEIVTASIQQTQAIRNKFRSIWS